MNETLSDMRPLAARFEELGFPAHAMTMWFANTLRDAFALTVSGAYADFAAVAEAAAISVLAAQEDRPHDLATAARHIVAGLSELPLHDDVRPALERLHAAGTRSFTLTNGSRATAARLLERAGIAQLIEDNLPVDGVRRYKPAPEAYHYALARAGVEPAQAMLVAVHPWDIGGAKRAGLRAGWINRGGVPYPSVLREPDVSAGDFVALADALLAGR